MDVLFVGDLNEHSRARQRCRALRELGHAVVAVPSEPTGAIPGVSGGPSLMDRVWHRLGYPRDPAGANAAIRRAVSERPFDVLWVDKSVMVRPSTLRFARRVRPALRIVSHTEDNMFVRKNASAYYRSSLPLFDVVFTTKSFNRDPRELPSLGARNVVFVQNTYDPHTHGPVEVRTEDRIRLGADVGFVGTFEEDRARSMLFLAEGGVDVRVWGNGWRGWVDRHPRLRVENRPLYGRDYVRALCATRINLCFLRKMNRDLHTARSLEIPACGGFMLAERTDEHRRLFEEGREAAYFGGPDELLALARHYLEHESERARVAAAGRERCLRSGYSHHERLRDMLREVA